MNFNFTDSDKDKRFYFERDRVVLAGAGTGKTYALVTQYLHLCAGLTAYEVPVAPQQIAVVTFTEKAALELKERISQRIERLIHLSTESLEKIAEFEPELWKTSQILNKSLPSTVFWHQCMLQLSRSFIGTFHAFGSMVMRKYGSRIGIESSFRVLTENESTVLFEDAARRCLLQYLSSSGGLVFGAVLSEYGGKGGSRAFLSLLMNIIKKQVEHGVYLRRDIQVNLSDIKKNLELLWREKIIRLISYREDFGLSSQEKMADVHRLIHSDEAGNISAENKLIEIKNLVKQLRFKTNPSFREEINKLREEIDDVVDQLFACEVSVSHQQQSHLLENLCDKIYEAYQREKKQKNVVDFSDLLLGTCELLRADFSVLKELQQQYGIWLVDEMQDTNAVQAEILSWLIYNTSSFTNVEKIASPGRLYIVGDRKQSIYAFRGANVEVFQSLCEHLSHQGANVEALQISRRSTTKIIEFTNRLFSQMFAQEDETKESFSEQWNDDVDRLLSLNNNSIESSVELLIPSEQEASQPPVLREAAMTALYLKKINATGHPWNKMAILLRRFTHVKSFTAALNAQGIPYKVVNGRGLYQTQEVRDIATALITLFNSDKIFRFALLRSPFCGVSDKTLVILADEVDETWDSYLKWANANQGEQAEQIKEFLERWLPLEQSAGRLLPSQCIQLLLSSFELPTLWKAIDDGNLRLANAEFIIEQAIEFETTQGNLNQFALWLWQKVISPTSFDLATAQAEIEQENAVLMMTIHQAKGLEFDTVIIPQCATYDITRIAGIDYEPSVGLGITKEGDEPASLNSLQIRKLRKQKQHAESKRLFYVAVTRARARVVFLGEGKATKTSWRAQLDKLLMDDKQTILQVTKVESTGPTHETQLNMEEKV